MAYGNNYNGPVREKNALDDTKLRLWADPVNGSKGSPSLQIVYTDVNPRINVYTNVPGDKDDGRISAALDMYSVGELFQMLRDLADPTSEKGTNTIIETKKPARKDGKATGELWTDTTVVVGKDKDGRIYISVLAYDKQRPKIKFYFGNGLYSVAGRIVNGERVADSDESISRRRCLAWVNQVEGILQSVAAIRYKHPEKPARDGDRRPGNRGGGSGGGSSGGGNRRDSGGDDNMFENAGKDNNEFDDDIPF